jgi:ABC-type antimicrobial peptide transport system permease subunit
VLAYALTQRRKEIGIRMALGATATDVIGLVLTQSVRLAAIGAGVGIVVMFAVMKILNAVVHLGAISMIDLVAFASGLALGLAATAVASCQPARRAAHLDPFQTLRSDAE